MGTVTWGQDIADAYDETYRAEFAPEVLDPMVDLLAELAGDGPLSSSRSARDGSPWR